MFHGKRFSLKPPHHVTALQTWMLATGRTDIQVAGEVSALLPEGKTVTSRQIARWRKGWSIPRLAALRALHELTDGKVDANSFLGAEDQSEGDE